MPIQPAQNPLNQINRGFTATQPPYNPASVAAQNPISTNPIYRRPVWTYVGFNDAPRRGPQPRLALGTGLTGGASMPGNAPQLPGYVVDNQYFPVVYNYQPGNDQNFQIPIPRTINTGENGRGLVGTYEPHDVTIGQRFFHQGRSATNWQVISFPPNLRNLLAWQQVQRYRINSVTLSARPLDSSQYFLGYQTNPQVARAIGQNGLGYMGSQ